MKRRTVLTLALGLAAASCRSPDPAYFTLAARPAPPLPGPPGPRLVELRRIGLAGYLDRPEIVRSNADYRLRLETNERWPEPPADMIARVLAENLNSRLPGTTVFSSTGAIASASDRTLEIDVQRFDVDASGQVVLLAQVAVSRAGGTRTAQAVRLAATPAGPTTTDMVAAMSTVLGQLADRIVPMLRA